MIKPDHYYQGADKHDLRCTCGHAESHRGGHDFLAACERMNRHIRDSVGEDEWNTRVKRSHATPEEHL